MNIRKTMSRQWQRQSTTWHSDDSLVMDLVCSRLKATEARDEGPVSLQSIP